MSPAMVLGKGKRLMGLELSYTPVWMPKFTAPLMIAGPIACIMRRYQKWPAVKR